MPRTTSRFQRRAGRSRGVWACPQKAATGSCSSSTPQSTAHAYDANLARGRTAARIAAVDQLATVQAAQKPRDRCVAERLARPLPDARRPRRRRRLHERRESRRPAAHHRRRGGVPDRAEDSVALLLDAARARAAGVVRPTATRARTARSRSSTPASTTRTPTSAAPARPPPTRRRSPATRSDARLSRPGQDRRRLRLRRRRIQRRPDDPAHVRRRRPTPTRSTATATAATSPAPRPATARTPTARRSPATTRPCRPTPPLSAHVPDRPGHGAAGQALRRTRSSAATGSTERRRARPSTGPPTRTATATRPTTST